MHAPFSSKENRTHSYTLCQNGGIKTNRRTHTEIFEHILSQVLPTDESCFSRFRVTAGHHGTPSTGPISSPGAAPRVAQGGRAREQVAEIVQGQMAPGELAGHHGRHAGRGMGQAMRMAKPAPLAGGALCFRWLVELAGKSQLENHRLCVFLFWKPGCLHHNFLVVNNRCE